MNRFLACVAIPFFLFGCTSNNVAEQVEVSPFPEPKHIISDGIGVITATEMRLLDLATPLESGDAWAKEQYHEKGYTRTEYLFQNSGKNVKKEMNLMFLELCKVHDGSYDGRWCSIGEGSFPLFKAYAVERFYPVQANKEKPSEYPMSVKIFTRNNRFSEKDPFELMRKNDFERRIGNLMPQSYLLIGQKQLGEIGMHPLVCMQDIGLGHVKYGWLVSADGREGLLMVDMSSSLKSPLDKATRVSRVEDFFQFHLCRAEDVIQSLSHSEYLQNIAIESLTAPVALQAWATIDYVWRTGLHERWSLEADSDVKTE